ncbi:sulfite exporter TauE/SafE family protein [Actinokineospora sp. PR83]|uniref:sulfite exporter TauE/SafE family protein n=1 Tax=Actinokineospora sp. PR83 TaxID=2884908 RepID=UPI001F303B21|nr:sulfite exporter TauE/SafE family protein [Actinokineospora sp. PR83]MCG8914815.1 sulfite exporter TauE/SafE family protein [Actinokineospora sp. PR83]
MTFWESVLVLLAGVFAGGINVVVGSGTLVTFPVLLAVGYPPIVANVSNTLGLVPGSITGAIGYRAELADQKDRLLRFGAASLLGGVLGAVLLLKLPAAAFEGIVPALIVVALVLVVLQPRLSRALAARRTTAAPAHGGPLLWFGVFLTGVYGGYFGAAQGIILLGLMGILMTESLQRLNAVKNVLAALVNAVSGIIFVVVADVAWLPVVLIAVGSTVGGFIGAKVGRRLSPTLLRGIIVVVGLAAIAKIVLD